MTEEFQEEILEINQVYAHSIRVGNYCIINGRPCKVTQVYQTGTATTDKVNLFGTDIFTGGKYNSVYSSNIMVSSPVVRFCDYTLIEIVDDIWVTLESFDGTILCDVKMPEDATLVSMIKDIHTGGGKVIIKVMSTMGESMIVSAQESSANE